MIAVLGINHKTANVNIRESFYISTNKVGPLAEDIIEKTNIKEILVFSTCNRTEIYFYKKSPCLKKDFKAIIDILHDFLGCQINYSDAFYTLTKKEAVRHLFRVTSGVDSMLLGEVQIVNQVKEAYLTCTKLALTDAVLMRMFQKSFETSKRVRSETNIQKGATSVSYVGIDQCINKLKSIKGRKVLMIGTGGTGKKALSHLKKNGAEHFLIANRTYKNAEMLAIEFGGKAIPFDEITDHLAVSDIVITATNAGEHIISFSDVQKYSGVTRHTPQVFLDLSVPRNIEECVGNLRNITLLGVDDLQEVTDKTVQIRMDSVDKAEEIIDLMTEEFMEWYNNRKLRSIITTISTNMQKVHEKELENSMKCYSSKEFAAVKEYSGRLSQKYSRLLIKSLKKIANGSNPDNVSLKKINELFDLYSDD